MTRILVIQGHPDGKEPHLCQSLADVYCDEAQQNGHLVRRIDLAAVTFPLLRSHSEWRQPPSKEIALAQESVAWADHIVLIFPLWLGCMPALLKGFLEQLLRPGFALTESRTGPKPLLTGKTASVIVTMCMPSSLYPLQFRPHELKVLERNVLRLVGIRPLRRMIIGRADKLSLEDRDRWLDKLRLRAAVAG
ncbi:NAD(P)H-dependent oxidoreductase [Flaviflagellibacter deserti]|uniref:NAD(P)H-dependent oxidoreductase n=1 Tax=Flaviflagellibacter deserti TaxID=2267266 RepID=A0ABV9Z496_9HYPH